MCRRVCRADADVEVEQEFYKRTVPATNEAQTGEVRLSWYASVYTTAACTWCYCVWGGGVCGLLPVHAVHPVHFARRMQLVRRMIRSRESFDIDNANLRSREANIISRFNDHCKGIDHGS